MEKKEKESRFLTNWLFLFLFAILMAMVYSLSISKNSLVWEWIALGVSILFLLINFCYSWRNQKKISRAEKRLPKVPIENLEKSPLELFLIDAIWHHQKVSIKDYQVAAEFRYALKTEKIIRTETGFCISSKISFAKMDALSIFIYEISFLSRKEYLKGSKMKLERLQEIQKKKETFSREKILSHIRENLLVMKSYPLLECVEKNYFVSLEDELSAKIQIGSIFLILFNFIEAIAFVNHATISNFYLPVIFSFCLVVLLTSKSRGRFVYQEEKREEMSNIFSYIEKVRREKKDLLYLSVLGNLDDKSRARVMNF